MKRILVGGIIGGVGLWLILLSYSPAHTYQALELALSGGERMVERYSPTEINFMLFILGFTAFLTGGVVFIKGAKEYMKNTKIDTETAILKSKIEQAELTKKLDDLEKI